jgi:Ca-activated chloride channel homolog
MKTSIQLDQEIHPHGHVVRALLRIEGAAPAGSQRTPLNLSVVLDRSGSMGGHKLRAAREAAALLVQKLAPEDVVSVVAYDNDVTTIAAPRTGDGAAISSQIRGIQAGGSTNLSGGWLKGREYVALHKKPGSANRVVLLTDGQANVGIQDPAQLAGLCATANEQGIRTTTIGFGSDYDENLLKAMADAGGGNLHYIEHTDQAPAVFAEEIEGLLSLAAQNLTLRITPAASVQAVAVHHSYPRQDVDGALQLELGDLYAREPKLVLIELLVPTPASGSIEIARLVLRAAVLRDDGSIELQEVSLPIATSIEDGPIVNPEVRRELLLLEVARLRTDVNADQHRGNYEGAATKLKEMSAKLRAAGIDDPIVLEEAADLEVMASHLEERTWSAAETKYMAQRSYDAGRAMKMKQEIIRRGQRRAKD